MKELRGLGKPAVPEAGGQLRAIPKCEYNTQTLKFDWSYLRSKEPAHRNVIQLAEVKASAHERQVDAAFNRLREIDKNVTREAARSFLYRQSAALITRGVLLSQGVPDFLAKPAGRLVAMIFFGPATRFERRLKSAMSVAEFYNKFYNTKLG